MTVFADDRNCIHLPNAKPGDAFELLVEANGKILLIPVSAGCELPANVTIEKVDGFSVGILDRPIDEDALKEALASFP